MILIFQRPESTETCMLIIYVNLKQLLRNQNVIKVFINLRTIADKENLYCITSGAPCTKNVEEQIFNAEANGKDIKEKFIK